MVSTLLSLLFGAALLGALVRALRPRAPSPALALAVVSSAPPPPRAPEALPAPPRPVLMERELLMDRVGGDLGLLGEIAAIFRQDAPERLHQMREAARAEDSVAFARATHALRGSLSNLCSPELYRAATALEEAARSGPVGSEALARVDALEADVERLNDELARLLRQAA